MFEIGDVLTLDDNKDYVVSQAQNCAGDTYILLVEMPDSKSFKFARVIDETQIEEINDAELIKKLSMLFYKTGK